MRKEMVPVSRLLALSGLTPRASIASPLTRCRHARAAGGKEFYRNENEGQAEITRPERDGSHVRILGITTDLPNLGASAASSKGMADSFEVGVQGDLIVVRGAKTGI